MSSTHHISRLQYKVSCPDEEQAFALRHLLSTTATSELAEAMQQVCDRYVREDHFIRIPKLEIHLEGGSAQGLAGELAARFTAKLEAELQRLKLRTEELPYEPVQEADALLYYLEHGYLPHWGATLAPRIHETAAAVIHRSPERVRQLLSASIHNQRLWERIRTQLSAEAGAALIRLLPALSTAAGELQSAWIKAQTESAAADLQQAAGAGPAQVVVNDLVLRNAQDILLERPSPARLMERLVTASGSAPAAVAPEESSIQIPEAATTAAPEEAASFGAAAAATLPQVIAPVPLQEAAGDEVPEKLFTHTAGLVLLHPFLKPFFTGLRLLHEGDWVDEPSRQRAIHLLHYLATGLQEQGEWNLLLEKLLCGLTPDFPIERRIQLTNEETGECDALLQAVIGHWSALKKTSPRALQEMFLRRDGLLQQSAGKGWQLQTERKTADVLLEALPWGFSLVKPVWNDYTIEVLWN